MGNVWLGTLNKRVQEPMQLTITFSYRGPAVDVLGEMAAISDYQAPHRAGRPERDFSQYRSATVRIPASSEIRQYSLQFTASFTVITRYTVYLSVWDNLAKSGTPIFNNADSAGSQQALGYVQVT